MQIVKTEKKEKQAFSIVRKEKRSLELSAYNRK